MGFGTVLHYTFIMIATVSHNVMDVDPYGRAIRDFHHDELDEPLIQRDGEEMIEHPIERFYFTEFTAEDNDGKWIKSWLNGPLLDMGAGVGRHTLYFQKMFETVAIERSDHLIATMRERGVNDVRSIDMFAVQDAFKRNRFQSVFAYGTQVGLVGSMQGLREFLDEIAFITKPDATAVLDCYDPTQEDTLDLLGYRADPTPGLAYRVMQFEYKGDLGEILLFRLFSPDRLRAATTGTEWEVAEVKYASGPNKHHYQVALTKP